ASAAKPAPAPATDIAAATAAAIAANYSEGTPVDNLQPKPVVPVAVSIDRLLEAMRDSEAHARRTGVRVVGPQQGRRRAGRTFGPEAQVIPAILLGEDELLAIDGDPLLSWSV
ncbi:hypothetical protein LTR94_032603, partial [Friedmanniomyces endolithicus]